MVDGRLLLGHLGRAGHLGHICLDPNGPPAIPNLPGSLEDAIGNCTIKQRTEGRFATTHALVAAHQAGKLKPEHDRAYFGRPRPILELYDLEKDPGELNNLAGKPEYRDIQQTLSAALLEKQITDYLKLFDYDVDLVVGALKGTGGK